MTLKELVAKALRGQERLVIVFWVYGVLLQAVLVKLGRLLSEAAVQTDFKFAGISLAVAVLTVLVAYSIGSAIAIWRCAYNVRRRFWGHVARVFVVASLAYLPVNLYETVLWFWENFSQ